MQKQSESIHLRPQLTHKDWMTLDGAWGFAYDDADHGLDERWQDRSDVFTRIIQVPYESLFPGITTQVAVSIIAEIHARKTVDLPDDRADLLVGLRLHLLAGCSWSIRQLGCHADGRSSQTPA